MRTLAAFAFSFAAAVFLTIYAGLDPWLLPLGGALAGLALLLLLLPLPKGSVRKRVVLILSGLAAGFLWTAVYMAVFFQPARELDGQTVRMSATVADWPQEGTYGGYTVVVSAETERGVNVTAILYLDGQGEKLRPGDRIETIVHCTLGDRTFSGEEISYYTAKGIFLRGTAYGRLDVRRSDHVSPRYYPVWASKALKAGIDAAFPEDAAGFVRALVTGSRDNLTGEFTTSLARAGLNHMVAVSGMHLAFLATVLTTLLGRGKRTTAFFTIVWVALFCGVAGNTPSVLRSAVMILLLQFAPLLDREQDGPTALALALLLLLGVNPFSAAHIGLQMSFAAVAGILLASDRVQDWLLRRCHMDELQTSGNWRQKLLWAAPKFAISTFSATLGASIFTVPLAALHFRTVSLIAPISNLLAMWAIGLLFLGGLGVGTLAVFLPGPAAVLALPFTALVRYLQWVVDLASRPALAALPLESVYYRMWLVLVYALVVLFVLTKGRRPVWMPLAAGAAGLVLAVALTRASFYSGQLAVTVLDVGQGQSVLVRTGTYLTLVDCGGDSRDNPGDVAADYLQALGISSLDLLVVSHYHADHANGVPQLLSRVKVDAIALPDVEEDDPLRVEIAAAARARNVQVMWIQKEIDLEMGSDKVSIFPPMAEEGTANELGLTVLATVGQTDVLITGDMEQEGERRLVGQAALPDIEVLVVGHHGSDTSSTPELLEAVKPDLALISVGLNNKYGHPSWDTLVRLDQIGAAIYRTDLYGTIEVQY